MDNQYIKPRYVQYDSVEKFLYEKTDDYYYGKDNYIQFEELEEKANLLIVGEPGIGKSELLKRQFNYLKDKNLPVAILDLKMLKFYANPDKIINDFFEIAIEKISKSQNNDDELNLMENGFDFKNINNKTLILDGLDEIDTEYFEVIFKEIINLNNKYKNLNIFVSCRSYYVDKHKLLFSNTAFEVLNVLPFNYVQIANYLEDIIDFNSFLKEYRESNLISFWGKNTFLNTPRYLKYYRELIETIGFDKVKEFKRFELIEKVIYYRIKNEVEKLKRKRKNSSYNIELIIQVLEKISLILEMQESNTISKEDFSQFFLESNFSLHNEISLAQLQQNTILKDFDKNLQFDNTEFQEYLAAKQISRTSKYEQIFYDLTIDENIKEFKHSWLNVLTFLAEIKPELVLPIIQLGDKLDDNNLFQVLKFIKKDDFDVSIKSKLFQIVLGYFNKHKLWVNDNITNIIAEFGRNNLSEIKNNIISNPKLNDTNYVMVGNSCIIISSLIKNNFTNSNEFVDIKLYLHNYLKTKIKYREVVCRYGMECLMDILGKDEIKKKVIKYYGKLSNSISSVIVHSLAEKYPNEDFAINVIIKDISSERISSDAYMLNNINTSDGIVYLLKYISTELNSEHRIYDSLTERISNRFERKIDALLKNIENCWDSEIEQVVIQILYKTFKRIHFGYLKENKFLYQLINILLEKNEIIIHEIIINIDKSIKEKWEKYFAMSILTNESNYKIIINFIILNEAVSINLFLSNLRQYNPEVFQFLNEEYRDLVLQFERIQNENYKAAKQLNSRTVNYSEKNYKKFILCLSKGHYHIIHDYEFQKSDLNKFITDLDKSKIQNFILTKVFKELDTPNYTHYFEDSLDILKEMGRGNTKELLLNFREKVIQCIIFYSDFEYLESILGKITTKEIIDLKNYFKQYKTNFQEYRIKYFYKFLNRINDNVEKDELKEIIKADKIDFSLRLIALELYAKDYLELAFLEEFLKNYGVKLRTNELDCMFIYEVNKVLVQNGSDYAVKWLIDNILFNKYEFRRNENSKHVLGSVSPLEGVGKNIEYIKSFKYSQELIELIIAGIKLMNKNHSYYEFVDKEIWAKFVDYCKQMDLTEKEYLDFRDKLKNILEDNKDKWGINWFKYKTDTILLGLRNKITKQKINIASTIQKHEELTKRKYLNISFPSEVLDAIKEIIEIDIPNEIEKGNFNYLFTTPSETKNEDFYEKLLTKEIELQLLKKGFRKNDIYLIEPKIFRQIQGLNDERTDLLISYGAIGSILIELKKQNNKIDQQYKEGKLKSYMKITGADYCVCLIINDKMKTKNFDKKIENYKQDLEDSTYLISGINFVM